MGRGLRLGLARKQELSFLPQLFQNENFHCGRSGPHDSGNRPKGSQLAAVLRYAHFLFCVHPRAFILLMHVRLHGLAHHPQMADPFPRSRESSFYYRDFHQSRFQVRFI